MADTYEKDLGQKSSLTTSDFIRVVGSDNVSYKQSLQDLMLWKRFSTDSLLTEQVDALPIGMFMGYINSYGKQTETGLPSNANFYVRVFTSNNVNYREIRIVSASNGAEYSILKTAGNWGTWTKMPTRAEVDALTNQQQRYVDMTVTSGYITIPITGVTSESSVICTIERTTTSIAQMLIAYPQPTTNKIFVYVRKATGGTPDDGTTVTINVRWSNS